MPGQMQLKTASRPLNVTYKSEPSPGWLGKGGLGRCQAMKIVLFLFHIPHPHSNMEVRASLREHHVQKYGMSQHCTGALAPLPRLKKAAVSKNSCRVWNSHCTWIPTTRHPPSIPSTPTHSLLSPATQLTTECLLHYISARTALEALLQNATLFNRAFPLGQKEHNDDMAHPSRQQLMLYK